MVGTYDALLYLIGCALNGNAPKEHILDGVNLRELHKLAKAHSVVCLVGYAIEKMNDVSSLDADLIRKFREEKEKAVRKCLMFDSERAALLSELEKSKIWYAPLKGVILKDYYPRYGMREMSDNDILFDAEKRKEVRDIFKKHGYEVESYNQGNHDVYLKAPVFNFEMHVELFSAYSYPDLAAKYDKAKEFLVRDDNNGLGYHFSDEDYYVYVLAHAHKHYCYSGTGIRTLADIYVIQKHLGNRLDWDYVNRELSNLGLLEYEQESKKLAEKLFGKSACLSDIQLTESERQMLSYYLNSGSYGNVKNRVNNRLHELETDAGEITFKTKSRYVLGRLFPGRKWFEEPYPFLYKFPILIPFFWIWRILFRGLRYLSRNRQEYDAVRNTK